MGDPARAALLARITASLEVPLEMEEVVLDGDGLNASSVAGAIQELKDLLTADPILADLATQAQKTVKHTTEFQTDVTVQSLGCAVLMKLALVEDAEARPALLTSQAPSAVLGAMQSHPRERDLQFYALASVVNLGGQDDSLNVALGTTGLPAAVVAALEQFFEDREVQSIGSWAVLSLSVSKKNRDLLSKTTVTQCLVNALRNFEGDVDVQLYGLKALSNLCASFSIPSKDALGTLGAIPLVLKAMETFGHERDVVHTSATAMRNLALHSEKNKAELRGAGALELLARMHAQYPTDSLVVDAVLKAQKELQAPPPPTACCVIA